MKTIDKIPIGKLQRATKIVKTGIKVGGNYLSYYGEKVVNPDVDREDLDRNNAEDIYDGLKSLKGSALKVAQMLSMEKNLIPQAYVDKFSLAQFSVPPLSAPLVRKTFKRYLGKSPEELFDQFDSNAIHGASIGQVHQAELDGKKLAVKIQYPGVAESIRSDLALVKPIAIRMFNLKGKDSEKYFKEVENKLLEETDYLLEVAQSMEARNACMHLDNIKFPNYYPDLSTERIIVMDWMDGAHLAHFTKSKEIEVDRNKIGQTLWDFYMYQIHRLRKVHADPHPGNFLINGNGELIVIDFGCMKAIPEAFYRPYFELSMSDNINDPGFFKEKLYELEILRPDDNKKEIERVSAVFKEMISLFTQPLNEDRFDFSNPEFFKNIADLGQKFSNDAELKKMNGSRGSKHFLYLNRTFFGLYHLLHDLGSEVEVNRFERYG